MAEVRLDTRQEGGTESAAQPMLAESAQLLSNAVNVIEQHPAAAVGTAVLAGAFVAPAASAILRAVGRQGADEAATAVIAARERALPSLLHEAGALKLGPGQSQLTVSSRAFAGQAGVRAVARAPGLAFEFGELPLDDRNSPLFQRWVSNRFGVDLNKLSEGKIAVLHPRFKFPEKQLFGRFEGRHELGLWGDEKQGVGVAEYKNLDSARSYLAGARSVVRIGVRTDLSQPENFARYTGSGVFVGSPERGLVITNNHVVDSAKTLAVTTTDGQTFAARIVDSDPEQDLAMIKLTDAPAGMKFPTAKISEAESITSGSKVVALGHHGALRGLIASPGHYLQFNKGIGFDVLSLDSGTRGMSGGGVFDRSGSLIGISAKQLSSSIREDRALVGGINIADVRSYIKRVGSSL